VKEMVIDLREYDGKVRAYKNEVDNCYSIALYKGYGDVFIDRSVLNVSWVQFIEIRNHINEVVKGI